MCYLVHTRVMHWGQMGSTGLELNTPDSPTCSWSPQHNSQVHPKRRSETSQEALPFLWLSQQIYSVISNQEELEK